MLSKNSPAEQQTEVLGSLSYDALWFDRSNGSCAWSAAGHSRVQAPAGCTSPHTTPLTARLHSSLRSQEVHVLKNTAIGPVIVGRHALEMVEQAQACTYACFRGHS